MKKLEKKFRRDWWVTLPANQLYIVCGVLEKKKVSTFYTYFVIILASNVLACGKDYTKSRNSTNK
jgi:hypothetical protein